MASISRIPLQTLENGQFSSSVSLTFTNQERLALEFKSTKLSTSSSQARLVVLDDRGVVLETIVINDSDTKAINIGPVPPSVSMYVECLLGRVSVSVLELTGLEGILSGQTVETDDLGAGVVTMPKVTFTGLALFTPAGLGASGALTATGVAVGDRVLMALSMNNAAAGALTKRTVGTDCEAVVTVANQIQQIGATVPTTQNWLLFVAPATA